MASLPEVCLMTVYRCTAVAGMTAKIVFEIGLSIALCNKSLSSTFKPVGTSCLALFEILTWHGSQLLIRAERKASVLQTQIILRLLRLSGMLGADNSNLCRFDLEWLLFYTCWWNMVEIKQIWWMLVGSNNRIFICTQDDCIIRTRGHHRSICFLYIHCVQQDKKLITENNAGL